MVATDFGLGYAVVRCNRCGYRATRRVDCRKVTAVSGQASSAPCAIEAYYDGGCGACRRHVQVLARWDRHGRIRFVDIDAPGFDPASVGKTREQLMAQIHGRLPDGTWFEGVEALRRMHAEVGSRSVVALSRWPVIARLLDWGYALVARHRRRRGHSGARGVSDKRS